MRNSPWTIRTALEWTLEQLESEGVSDPRLSALWLLGAATGLSRQELYTDYDLPLTESQLSSLHEGVRRRIAKEPLQYILGKAPFRHLELIVRRGVLIPRPETEILVERLILSLKGMGALGDSGSLNNARVLDICTGSGCVALSLLQECPGLQLIATDIDPQAVLLARENAEMLGFADDGRLQIIEDDLAGSLVADPDKWGYFDALVSNPPYVPTEELANLPEEIAGYEPLAALDGGSDGLEVFRRIVKQAKLLLKPHGLLVCELFETRLEEAREYCLQEGFVNVSIHEDLNNRLRIIIAHNHG